MSPAASARILVVDDDRALRHAVSSLLERQGHSVLQAGDGPAALAHLAREQVQLVLLDMGLPGMTGLDLLSRVRGGDRPPIVVVITADDTPQTLLAAIRAQAYRYLTKPVSPAAIVDVVGGAHRVEQRDPADRGDLGSPGVGGDRGPVRDPDGRPAACLHHAARDRPGADVRESVAQAFRELLSNAIEWGGRLDPNRTVRISCIRARRMLLYRILDPGEGFNIQDLAHAAISNSPGDPIAHAVVREERGLRPGGLGLVMTRALVDELIYNEARNEVVFIKYLD